MCGVLGVGRILDLSSVCGMTQLVLMHAHFVEQSFVKLLNMNIIVGIPHKSLSPFIAMNNSTKLT